MGSIDLNTGSRVYLDTQFSIYSVESDPRYVELCNKIWQPVAEQSCEVITSELAVHEFLVRPFRDDASDLVLPFDDYFLASVIDVRPISLSILRYAALLRAKHTRLRAPDAIHIATAELNDCEYIVSNDRAWTDCTKCNFILLADLNDKFH